MKNPMDRELEKKLSQRAVEIGRQGETSAFDELLVLIKSPATNVRRLSASALGKLAWLGINQEIAVKVLQDVMRLDRHPQTRGLDTPEYKMSMYKKQTLYQQEGKKVISVYPADLHALDSLLTNKLRLYGFFPSVSEQSKAKQML